MVSSYPPFDYARRSPWSWRSQLTIWFQLVKIWVTTFIQDFATFIVGIGELTPVQPLSYFLFGPFAVYRASTRLSRWRFRVQMNSASPNN